MPKHLLPIPSFRQQRESDCLAACAAMLLQAVGVTVLYARLLDTLDIAPWGTPHRNISQITRIAPNIRVIYRQGELDDLYHWLDDGYAPIAFVWTGDLPYWSVQTWHAVVVIGYDEQSFYLNDPAFDKAPQIVGHGDFDLAWLAYDAYFAIVTTK